MKLRYILLCITLFAYGFSTAQQLDYKPFLETLFLHAKNDFKDIVGEENDTSIYRESKLVPDLGTIKISIMSYGANLTWTVPLSLSQDLQQDVDTFIKNNFSGKKEYVVANSDDLDGENFSMKNVYLKSGQRKPKLLLQTMVYKNTEASEKSTFALLIYGK